MSLYATDTDLKLIKLFLGYESQRGSMQTVQKNHY